MRPAATPDVAPRCGPEEHCITCGDEGIAMRVVDIDADRSLALCAAEGGERETVETALVGAVAAGDRLLVHAGVALVSLGDDDGEAAAA